MGHVPPRTLPRAGPGAHLPRCQRGEVGEDGAQALTDGRASIGAAGERFAATWLIDQGMQLLASNVEVDGGEIDLVMADGGVRVAVEVRSITGDGDPIDAVSDSKRAHVRRLGRTVGAQRVDYVGVGFRTWGVEVHWVPG